MAEHLKSILSCLTSLPHCGSRDRKRQQRNAYDAGHWTFELCNVAAQSWTLTWESL